MEPLPGTDLSAPYLAHRASAPGSAAASELLSRYRNAKPAGEGVPAAPSAAPASPDGEGEGSLPGRIGADIVKGAVETPRAIVGGIRDAYQNTIDLASEFGTWVEKAAKLPGLKVDGDGIRFVSSKELQDLRAAGHQFDFQLPDVDDPKSVTGSIVKNVSQFLTGMKGADKALKGLGIAKGAGVAGYSRTALQGALANFAAFDPHQQRLSNLVQSVPALANPVTEYLAADPSDGAAEGRFKNAVEGLGFGLLTDGVIKSVRLLRQVGQAKAKIEQAIAAEGAPGLADDAFKTLGDEADAKLVRRAALKEPPASGAADGVPPAKAAGPAQGEPGKVFINFARVDTGDDVKRVMQDLADMRSKDIDAARRGAKRSFQQTKLDASQLDAWTILKDRRVGEPLNAEQTLAARELWVSASERLSQMAQAAADSPSESNLFAFRKMLDVHNLVQQEVIAARTETARALASWRIPAGGAAERLRDVTGALEASGGADASRELAKRVAALARSGQMAELNAVVEKTAGATTKDAVIEGWIMGLLSSPKTHVVNTMSNASVAFLRMGERYVGARISSLLGDEGGVAANEAAAQWFGLTSGIKDAFRYAAKAWKTGETGMGIGKVEVPRAGSFGAEAFGLSSSGWLGRGVDLLGQLIRTPGRALAAEDEFFKTIGYRMELHAQAVRQAASEVNAGSLTDDAFKGRIADLIANPPENIRLASVDSALYQTFTNTPGKFGQWLSHLTSEYPGFKVILPFTRTPANIMRYTFERTPLAPLMGQFRANLAAGGARRDLALAQVSLGTMAMLSFADLTMSGQVTGRGPLERGQREALMRSGWQPYSIKGGDQWFTYNRLDPIGSMIGLAADSTETLVNAQHEALDDPDVEKLVVASSIAFAGNIVNKTYLSGLSSIIEAMNDPQRSAEQWAQRLAGSIVPAGVAAAGRVEDPYLREVYSMMDAIRARTPGLSDNLPARLNLWGEKIDTRSGYGAAYDMLAPVNTRKENAAPIDKEILRLGVNIVAPGRRTSFGGVTVDLGQYPKAYSRYIELAGNQLKHPAWNMGAKDYLNAVVEGKHPMSQVYRLRSDGPDGGKDIFIRDTLRSYQELARRQILQEFPDIQRDVTEKQAAARELRMPVTQ